MNHTFKKKIHENRVKYTPLHVFSPLSYQAPVLRTFTSNPTLHGSDDKVCLSSLNKCITPLLIRIDSM